MRLPNPLLLPDGLGHRRQAFPFILIAWLGLLWVWYALPRPLFRVPYSAVLLDQNGQLLSARISADGQWRFPVSQRNNSKYSRALLTYEDRRFRFHRGIDPLALASAWWYNQTHAPAKRGGSTLTMQVIRMALGNPPRTYLQKIREMGLATLLEFTHTKDQILAYYTAHAPFGGNVVGLEAATWRYFGKDASQLTWAEASLLAVLPNSPGLIHPGRNRERLRQKRNQLLDRLRQQRYFDHDTWRLAREEPLPGRPYPLPMHAPHLLARTFPPGTGGIAHTSLDLGIQERLAARLRFQQERLADQGIHNAAALVLEVNSGRVLAYLGNTPRDIPGNGSEVDLITANRSSGSVLKPLLYALCLQEALIGPDTWLRDVPLSYRGYRPANFDQSHSGLVPAGDALIRSLNIPFVELLKTYGIERFHRQLKAMGIHSLTQSSGHYGLSLILGGAEVNLWDLCGAYGSMARTLLHFISEDRGPQREDWHPPWYLQDKRKVADDPSKSTPMLRAGSIYPTFLKMTALKRPDEDGIWQVFPGNQPIAWKTGTSFGFRDAWAVGVTTAYCVGIWAGNANGEGRPGLTGARVAAPLLFTVFDELPEKGRRFPRPASDLHPIPVCRQSGWQAGPYCPTDTTLGPVAIRLPALCLYHKQIQLSADRQFRTFLHCADAGGTIPEIRLVLPPLEGHFFQRIHPEYRPLPPLDPRCQEFQGAKEEENPMEWIYPREYTRIRIPHNLDGTPSRIVFQLAHRSPGKTVFWHLDADYLGKTRAFHQITLHPPPGNHRLLALDEDGNRTETSFEVLGDKLK